MKNYKIIAISAVSIDGAIGIDNEIPWHISEDFKHFRNTTIGHTLIVGGNTYLTLPEKAFESRDYLVLDKDNIAVIKRPNVNSFKSVDELLRHIYEKYTFRMPVENENNIVFVVGGAMIYDLLIDYCDEAIITWVNKLCPNANKHFPIQKLFANFDAVNEQDWQKSKSGILYKITNYKKTINYEDVNV